MSGSAWSDDPTDTGVNPPHIDGRDRPMSKGELYEYHKNNGTLPKFYELFPEHRPRERER